jgi:hypothetical protein
MLRSTNARAQIDLIKSTVHYVVNRLENKLSRLLITKRTVVRVAAMRRVKALFTRDMR